jgi:allophanate hydrolase
MGAAAPIRVVLGPQADHFDADMLQVFLSTGFSVTPDADRMGVRLAGTGGAVLKHNARGSEIVTDATVPGSIQVPGNGQPLVLLADGQTAGGYPKIATVASADLARLALAPVGTVLRFEAVSIEQAEDAARDHAAALDRLLASIEPLALDGDVDLQALYAGNLVSGMIDALS